MYNVIIKRSGVSIVFQNVDSDFVDNILLSLDCDKSKEVEIVIKGVNDED